MTNIRKSDFYYGSLLSVFINNGIAPAIVEPGEKRRVYSVTTDQGEYEIYTKYVSMPAKRKDEDNKIWTFTFSQDELRTIDQYQVSEKNYIFALICGVHEKMQNSEIAVLTLEQVKDCLDFDLKRTSQRITVKIGKGQRSFRIYGTGRTDQLNGKDNTLRIKRGALSMIEEEPIFI